MSNLNSLNPQQRLAVETLQRPVLILAGAGTGKTRVITSRIAHMISRGIPPENILAVTFTNKAAREMQERVSQLLPRIRKPGPQTAPDCSKTEAASGRPAICTFHSLCVRILRQHIEKLGYKRNFVIYDESDQIAVIKKILSRISVRREKADPAEVLSMLGRFKNGGARAAVSADSSLEAMAGHIRSSYESALRAANAVDFDDLLLLTLRLFGEQPQVLTACRAQYKYVMVDEYQDTNAAQFNLVHALTREHRNLCVVGDDDQSIYGWRGAEIANLLDMERHFPEVKIIMLEQNYRSTNTILNAANAIIKHNVRRRGKNLWSQKGDGAKISLRTFRDDDDEARCIAEEIEFARMARRVPWSHQAILFRTNAQSRPLEMALRQASIRYHLIGGQSFFDRREVRDLLAYFKTFLNPNDDVSLLRIANTPSRGLSDGTMQRLLALSNERNCPVFEVMGNPVLLASFQSKTRLGIESFVSFLERTRQRLAANSHTVPAALAPAESLRQGRQSSAVPEAAGLGDESSGATQPASAPGFLARWADHFLDEIAYFDELRRVEKTAEAAESRIRNIRQLIASLDARAAASPREQLQDFLEEVTLDTEHEAEDDAPQDAVTLITMHSCKGLEFPRVSIVGMEDGLLPHSRSRAEGTLDEERRLFYVALTRAMHVLSISHCATRMKFGKPESCRPSPFLKELPADLVEHADQRARQPVAPAAGAGYFAAVRGAIG